MSSSWMEQERGLLFPADVPRSTCVTEALERLCLENRAMRQDGGVLIPHESAVLLTREEQELLGLPPANPYRLMLRAQGDLGHNNLRYFMDVLKPDGTPFIHPSFRGCLLHLDSETCYLMNSDQYQLVAVASQSNQDISHVERRELSVYNLVNLAETCAEDGGEA